MSRMAIQWNSVSFSVRQGFWMKSKRIVSDMNLAVPMGTVLGMVGPNGAGKTTTIKLGAGLLHPESGRVLIQEHPATESGARACIGLLTETQYIYPYLRLQEWLMMMGRLSGLDGKRLVRRVAEVIELMDLKAQSRQFVKTLSKGQLQRAGLAQALLHEPDILFLDEPMSGLDPYWRHRVQHILLDLKSGGRTILFSSHILVDVEKLSDQVALISGGRLRWAGRLSELSRNIKGYEAVCRTEHPEILKKIAHDGKIVQHPGGEWTVSISPDQKEELLRLVANSATDIVSLRPVQEEIEEVLFGFNHKLSESADELS